MGLFEEYDYSPDPYEWRPLTPGEAHDIACFRQAIADALAEPGRIVEFLIDFTRQEIRATPDGRVERRFIYKTPEGGREFSQWEENIPRRFLPPSAGGDDLHTVGPWKTNGSFAVDSFGRPVADCRIRGRFPMECEANAALIAAAPDLLYSLRAMVAAIETVKNKDEGASILSAWLPDARAAIAKAEGRPKERNPWAMK